MCVGGAWGGQGGLLVHWRCSGRWVGRGRRSHGALCRRLLRVGHKLPLHRCSAYVAQLLKHPLCLLSPCTGRWPDDPAAYLKTKAAIGLQLAAALEASYGLQVQGSEACLDVLTEGFAFRLLLATDRDAAMHAKAVAAAPPHGRHHHAHAHAPPRYLSLSWHHGLIAGLEGMHAAFGPTVRCMGGWAPAAVRPFGVHRTAVQGALPWRIWGAAAACSVCAPAAAPCMLSSHLFCLPKALTGLLYAVPTAHPPHPPCHTASPISASQVRLAQRWVGAHLLSSQLCPEAVELLVAAAFSSPGVAPPPGSRLAGLLRFLQLLARHPWEQRALVIDPDRCAPFGLWRLGGKGGEGEGAVLSGAWSRCVMPRIFALWCDASHSHTAALRAHPCTP